MINSYGPTTINGRFVKAVIYTKRRILPGEELVFDYPWL
jgi:SET domain-containing protein